jgi:hypothetical protein
MRSAVFAFLFSACALFAQSDRGAITGTITDPSGAVLGAAPVEAHNTANGVVVKVASSETGNYTIPSLPAGLYDLHVTVSGFKEYIRQGLQVQNAQTMRIDVALEVGSSTESVTVTDAAPLLKTESGEMSHVVSIQRMNNMPILQAGGTGGSAGIRNPIMVVALIPGSALTVGQTGPTVRINGGVNNSQTMLVEGMDASNSLGQGASQQNQVGVDSVQEFAVQTSNYAAEFGQAGSAIMNITMKSGTNAYHGSAYEYWVHEKLHSGQPLLNPLNVPRASLLDAGNPRPKSRRNDYGATFGGPVWIPKLYDGKNRTFFFLNFEQYRAGAVVVADAISVPTAAYRTGDFSRALLPNILGQDPLRRNIQPNMIYDPNTRRTEAGSLITDPFPSNIIPTARLDPVALKVQAFLPSPTNSSALVNNFQGSYPQERLTQVPSIKIDQVVGSKHRFSFLANRTSTVCDFCAGAEGLPLPVSAAIGTNVRAHTERLNWDTTLTPTLLLHWGIGYTQNWLGRPALANDIDATALLGLRGPFTGRIATFPNFTGLNNTQTGGSSNISSVGSLADDVYQQGTAILSLTWVKDNHTFKYGGELRNQGDYRLDESGINGTYAFGPQQTALPYVVQGNAGAQVAGNTIGFPYASFLLGLVNSGNVRPGSRGRIGKHQLGFYAQDTWKVTRKLTIDYGLRYDYSTYLKEQYGRMANLDQNAPNPTAGGHPGAVQYEATCNCNFANNYKFAFGPRLGVAYQVNSKTVLRGGFGIAYTGTPQYNLAGGVVSATNPFGPDPEPGREAMALRDGLPLSPQQIAWPNFSPGYFPVAAFVGAGPASVVDQNGGRPGRSYQWTIGLQREINQNLVVEASYVGNRQIWLTAGGLVNYNFLSTSRLQSYGLSLNNPADVTMLNAQINQAAAGRFRNQLPFAGFTGSVAQSLRPFPQFSSNLTPLWAPLGNAWYDSLQMKVTQRFSHGLDFTYAFTYAKELDTFSANTFDVQNRQLFKSLSSNSRPLISGIGINYQTPGLGGGHKLLSHIVRDWQVGSFLQYASALPFAPPVATTTPLLSNSIFQNTFQSRVPGEPLYTQDLNCHCFDPNTTFVLNPKAWVNPGVGQFGSATFYGDYRRQRRPFENLSFGRNFRLKEGVNLSIRGEMTNVLNRAFINDPTSANPAAVQTVRAGTTQTTAGFGFINNTVLNQGTFATGGGQPRQGQIVGRITF